MQHSNQDSDLARFKRCLRMRVSKYKGSEFF